MILDAQILPSAMKVNALVSMIVYPEWRDETMKVVISNGRVIRMSKKISKEEFSGTYTGITLFDQAINARFFAKMEELVEAGRVNEFSTLLFRNLSTKVYALANLASWRPGACASAIAKQLGWRRSILFRRLLLLSVAAYSFLVWVLFPRKEESK